MQAQIDRADAEYAAALAAGDPDVFELVAIGFVDPLEPQDVSWYALTNEHVHPAGNFTIGVGQLSWVLADAQARGMMDWDRVLWHSHVRTVEPSSFDVETFPAWLCAVGLVYHVPSGTTTVYNQSGTINSITGNVEPSLVTG